MTTREQTANPRPYVVAGMWGGIVQWDLSAPGTGRPIFDLLDFDREGEDDAERLEWIEYADEVTTRMREHGLDATDTEQAINRMRPGQP